MYHLYFTSELDGFPTTEEMLSSLPRTCRERIERYNIHDDRRRSAICYTMLKKALKEHFGTNDFEISCKEHGKPFLSGIDGVYFNLSHCKNACVCVVSDKEIGVDVQEVREYSEKTAMKVCCENELAILEKVADKAEEFTKIWAMKESLIKMHGDGFSYGLKNADTTNSDCTVVSKEGDCFIAVSEKNT
ncbi:MAG: 4'-phosphopantetheinyl transferase superfamily protein [Ruminococcus sp.]|nr:4'-phosphopantetheinyl transferase superfamily protein [Ruminococcus sp.]